MTGKEKGYSKSSCWMGRFTSAGVRNILALYDLDLPRCNQPTFANLCRTHSMKSGS